MDNKLVILYNRMLEEISRIQNNELPEEQKVEWCFKIATNYWRDVKRKLESYIFNNKEDEIQFYKSVKPKFTAYIEYFILLNHALLFVPTESHEAELLYWDHEWKRLSRFIERNKSFVEYMKSGSTCHDHQYFLPENYDLANFVVSKTYESDGEFVTSHDHLVAMLMAEEMYRAYIEKKLIRNND